MAKAVINLQKESGGIVKISPVDGTGVTELVVPESGNLVSVGTAVTDNAIARYDGTTGKLQNSGVIMDDSGNVGVGVTPSAWSSGEKAIELPHYGYFATKGPICRVASNVYDNYGQKYTMSSSASMYEQSSGTHYWKTAPVGSAGNAITWTNAMLLDNSGNLLLTSGTGALGYGAGAGGTVTQLTSKSTAVTLNKPSGWIIMNNSALAASGFVYFVLNNDLLQPSDGIVYNGLYGLVSPQNYRIETNFVTYGYVSIRVTNISNSTLSDAIEFSYKIIKGANS